MNNEIVEMMMIAIYKASSESGTKYTSGLRREEREESFCEKVPRIINSGRKM